MLYFGEMFELFIMFIDKIDHFIYYAHYSNKKLGFIKLASCQLTNFSNKKNYVQLCVIIKKIFISFFYIFISPVQQNFEDLFKKYI